MVKRQWPASGNWVLVFVATKDKMTANALVKLDAKGQVMTMKLPDAGAWDRAAVLPDGKTKLVPWSFTNDPTVVAMHVVSGDLKAAVDYTLKGKG